MTIAPKRQLALAVMMLSVGCNSGGTVAAPQSSYFWMMPTAVPDSGVRFWVPVPSPHSECDPAKWTPAVAFMTAAGIQADLDEHKADYHLLDTERGFVFQEYGSAAQGERERRIAANHYHGFYVEADTAKSLILSALNHQHGARQ